MPQAIGVALTAIGTAVGEVATAVGAISGAQIAVSAAAMVGSLALSDSQRRKAERAARAASDASAQDRLVNFMSTVGPRELVFGRMRKGGQVFYRASSNVFQSKLVALISLAHHEIDGVEEIFFNDEKIQTDNVGNVITEPYGRIQTYTERGRLYTAVANLPYTPNAGSFRVLQRTPQLDDAAPAFEEREAPFTLAGNTVTLTEFDPAWQYNYVYQHSRVESKAFVTVHRGEPTQVADGRMKLLFPGVWTDAHVVAGVAYIIVEFDQDDTAFPAGVPNVTVQLRGAKIYDPRSGLTVFTENPALMARHVMLHPQFGKRTSMTAAEDARIIAAANACDTAMSYTGSDLVAMFRAALVVAFGTPTRDVLDDLAQAMGGQWAYPAGELHIRAGVWTGPVMALTEADLAVIQRASDGSSGSEKITTTPHRARNDKVNTIVARIWDQAANYKETAIPPLRGEALVAADGGVELVQEAKLLAVFYQPQAYHIAGMILRDGRDPLTTVLPFKLTAYPLELFDVVTLTLAGYGWAAKKFQVIGRVFHPLGFLMLTLKETSSAIYQWGAGFQPQGYAPNTNLPKPWLIQPPTITSISSGESELIVQSDGTVINGVRVTWAPISDPTVTQATGAIEVRYAVMPSGEWITQGVSGSATQIVLQNIDDNAYIVVQARTKNQLATSDWGLQVMHKVIGKTEPPPNIESFTIAGAVLSWTMPRRVPDLAGFRFRFHYGSNTDWNSAAPLHTGLITASPYDLVARPGGVVTVMGKAVDTTGNESPQAVVIVMNLGDPTIANIVEVWDFKALGWPGDPADQVGWTLVGGNPTADATDSFYGDDDQRFYRADNDPFYRDETYSQMVYVSEPVSVSKALAGSVMTLVAETQGVDLRIDYRLAGPGAFYGEDGDAFYGPDDQSLYGAAGAWLPWPGQMVADNDVYQFRVTIGAGATQGVLEELMLTVDAPDLQEEIADLAISSGGTVVPHVLSFTSIKTVQATLQAGGSTAVSLKVDKINNLAPVIYAIDAAGTAVSGATADITLKGY